MASTKRIPETIYANGCVELMEEVGVNIEELIAHMDKAYGLTLKDMYGYPQKDVAGYPLLHNIKLERLLSLAKGTDFISHENDEYDMMERCAVLTCMRSDSPIYYLDKLYIETLRGRPILNAMSIDELMLPFEGFTFALPKDTVDNGCGSYYDIVTIFTSETTGELGYVNKDKTNVQYVHEFSEFEGVITTKYGTPHKKFIGIVYQCLAMSDDPNANVSYSAIGLDDPNISIEEKIKMGTNSDINIDHSITMSRIIINAVIDMTKPTEYIVISGGEKVIKDKKNKKTKKSFNYFNPRWFDPLTFNVLPFRPKAYMSSVTTSNVWAFGSISIHLIPLLF